MSAFRNFKDRSGGQRPYDPHELWLYFEGNGASAISVFSPDIESVTRFTDDDATEEMYRIKLVNSLVLDDSTLMGADVTAWASPGDDFSGQLVRGALNSTVAAETNLEFDICLRDAGVATNQVTTRVWIVLRLDLMEGLPE